MVSKYVTIISDIKLKNVYTKRASLLYIHFTKNIQAWHIPSHRHYQLLSEPYGRFFASVVSECQW